MQRAEWDDGESEEFDDLPDDAPSETLPCPECGTAVYEDAEQCPACGSYLVHSTSEWTGRPWWWIVLGLIGIAAVILVLMA